MPEPHRPAAGNRGVVATEAMSAELWERLARLDRCCRVVTMSRFVGQQRTGWWVRITPRDDYGRSITVESLTLPAALSDAVAQAEALRWIPS